MLLTQEVAKKFVKKLKTELKPVNNRKKKTKNIIEPRAFKVLLNWLNPKPMSILELDRTCDNLSQCLDLTKVDYQYIPKGLSNFQNAINLYKDFDGDIICGVESKVIILEYIQKAYKILKPGRRLCVIGEYSFLESESRKKFFDKHPFKYCLIAATRYQLSRDGDFSNARGHLDHVSRMARNYAWYVWEKPLAGETHTKPVMEWFDEQFLTINPKTGKLDYSNPPYVQLDELNQTDEESS